MVSVHSHWVFFLNAAAILSVAANGLYRTRWKYSNYVTATISASTPIPAIIRKNKLQLQIAQCERAFNVMIT